MSTESQPKIAGECLHPTAGATETAAEIKNRAKSGAPAKEFGGPKGPEPTRYGDWERNGKCVDF